MYRPGIGRYGVLKETLDPRIREIGRYRVSECHRSGAQAVAAIALTGLLVADSPARASAVTPPSAVTPSGAVLLIPRPGAQNAVSQGQTAEAAAAQSDAGQVQGVVRDQTRQIVFDALVTLTDDTGRQQEIRTDAGGRYRFEGLNPGRYTLTISREGFRDFSTDVRLRARQTASLDVTLMIAIAVSVDVRERDGVSAESGRGLSGLVLTGREIAVLPDNPSLFMLKLMQLAGSARPGDVAVYVDGFSEFKRFPPKETIDMIRINPDPFSAEFPGRSSRRIEITTKPGSDTFHGDVKFQGRDSAFNARNPMETTQPFSRYQGYSGYLQGPIKKDRAGFLLYGGYWQQDENAIVNATVLDAGRTAALPFRTTVPSPARTTSFMAKIDFKVFEQLINASYSRDGGVSRSQGLDGGFDLAERAYDQSSSSDVGRVWWTRMGRRSLHDLRVEITRSVEESTPQLTAPGLIVLDAFNAGGNQSADGRTSALGLEMIDSVTVQIGQHMLKSGGRFESTSQDSVSRAGFGGTFLFGADRNRDASGDPILDGAGGPTYISPIENYRRTLLGMPGYGPSQFSIVSGEPRVGISQWSAGWFVTDFWAASKRLSLSYGVRQELQNNLKARLNLAPRAHLSWLFDEAGTSSVKAGAGVFYENVDQDLTLRVKRLDGARQRQLIVPTPTFFPNIPVTVASAIAIEPTLYTKSDDLRMPHWIRTSVSYERQLPWKLWAVVDYSHERGVNLLRSRNINALAPGAATLARSPLFQYESSGRSSAHELQLTLTGNIGQKSVSATYKLARRRGDTDGASSLPADPNDLSADYGPLGSDRRHDFVASTTFAIPGGLYLISSLTVASGRPFNITTGRDSNNDNVFTDRPGFAKPGDLNAIATPYGLLNPNPRPGDPMIPRNLGRDPWQTGVNLSVIKSLARAMTITIDVENLLNQTRFADSNGVLISPTFGRPNRALPGRRLDFTMRYSF